MSHIILTITTFFLEEKLQLFLVDDNSYINDMLTCFIPVFGLVYSDVIPKLRQYGYIFMLKRN